MGNNVSTEAEKESGKLLDNKNSEKVTGLAGVRPSSYGTIGKSQIMTDSVLFYVRSSTNFSCGTGT